MGFTTASTVLNPLDLLKSRFVGLFAPRQQLDSGYFLFPGSRIRPAFVGSFLIRSTDYRKEYPVSKKNKAQCRPITPPPGANLVQPSEPNVAVNSPAPNNVPALVNTPVPTRDRVAVYNQSDQQLSSQIILQPLLQESC